MIVDYKDLSAVKKSVSVEVPPDAVRTLLDIVTNEFSRQAKIPGFRPGKIPVKVVRSRFQKEIERETVDRLLPKYFHEVVREKNVEPVGSPTLKHVDQITEGGPLRFEAEFEVKPSIELHDYRGISIQEVPVAIDAAEVEKTVDRLREQGSSFRTITDRPASENDYMVIDVSSHAEGVEQRTTQDYTMQLGENAPLPELTANLLGRSAGEFVKFEKSYGDDAPNQEVQNKTVTYEVTVKEVREMVRPDFTDEFAKGTGMAETAAELREKIESDLRRHKEHEATQAKKQQVTDRLVELHEVETPEALVEDELGKSMRNYARFLSSQGIDLEKAEIDWEKIRGDFQPEAVKRVKRALILEAIAKKEELSVADVEVDAEIRKAANAGSREFAEVRHRLREDGSYEELRGALAQEKALDFVVAEAKIS